MPKTEADRMSHSKFLRRGRHATAIRVTALVVATICAGVGLWYVVQTPGLL